MSQRLQELLANDARRRSEEVSSDSSGSGSAVRSSSGARSKRERDTSSDNLAAAAGTAQGRKSFDVPNAEGRLGPAAGCSCLVTLDCSYSTCFTLTSCL